MDFEKATNAMRFQSIHYFLSRMAFLGNPVDELVKLDVTSSANHYQISKPFIPDPAVIDVVNIDVWLWFVLKHRV